MFSGCSETFKLYSDNIVLKDRVISGYISVENHVISEIIENRLPDGEYLDFRGKYILPGLINFQCGSLIESFEKSEFKSFPDETVFLKVERDLALAGITTVFHDLAIERFMKKSCIDQFVDTFTYIKSYRNRDFLIDHKTNLKIRLGQVDSSENLRSLIPSDVIDCVTYIGDVHEDQECYKEEYQKQYIMSSLMISEEEAESVLDKINDNKLEAAADEFAHRIRYCIANNVSVATTKYKVVSRLEENYNKAINIISTPRSKQAWDYVEENQKFVVMDLENLQNKDCKERFISYNKNTNKGIVTARLNPELLLEYVFEIAEKVGMVDAVKLVTSNPASALRMEDTGELAVGKEADIIVVDANGSVPITILSVSDGMPIYKISYNPGTI
ncbi:MAG: amidohydrolase family protein [Filifactoraceae bacterium]